MKKLLFILFLIISVLDLYAQNLTQPLDIPIKINVNKYYFPVDQGNIYSSGDPDFVAGIVAYVFPKTFEEVKKDINIDQLKRSGVNVRYDMTGKTNHGYTYYKIEGTKFDSLETMKNMDVYYFLIDVDIDKVIFIMGTCEITDSTDYGYGVEIEAAAMSATIEKKQEEEPKQLNIPVEMYVNKSFFPEKLNDNTFYSKDPYAIITSMVVSYTFENAKKDLKKDWTDILYEFDGETDYGYKYYMIKGAKFDQELGIKMMFFSYVVEVEANKLIILYGKHDDKESSYNTVTTSMAKSAKLKEYK